MIDRHDAPVRDAYALVLAGGRGKRLGPLTEHRAKPDVPFAGGLKLIDFALSNCVHSGLRRMGVLTQYKAQSLIRHLERGWDVLPGSLGEFIDVAPAQQRDGEAWYGGTADAVWQNRNLIREAQARHLFVLGGDHVYKMDYRVMLQEHVQRGSQLTLACVSVPLQAAQAFGVLAVDAEDNVRAFEEKPSHPREDPERPGHALVSMGVYVFDSAFLMSELARDARTSGSHHDFGHDLIPALVGRARLTVHRFERSCIGAAGADPYWRDVGTLDAYFDANMDLTRARPALDLYDDAWPILSQPRQLPPAKFVHDAAGRHGQVVNSLVASGCVVCGATVRDSILFSKVMVGARCEIESSLLLPDVRCGSDVRLRRTIVDKHCRLPDGFVAGFDARDDAARGLHRTPGGVTVVSPGMLGQAGRGG